MFTPKVVSAALLTVAPLLYAQNSKFSGRVPDMQVHLLAAGQRPYPAEMSGLSLMQQER